MTVAIEIAPDVPARIRKEPQNIVIQVRVTEVAPV
jgi:hypothetical protein